MREMLLTDDDASSLERGIPAKSGGPDHSDLRGRDHNWQAACRTSRASPPALVRTLRRRPLVLARVNSRLIVAPVPLAPAR